MTYIYMKNASNEVTYISFLKFCALKDKKHVLQESLCSLSACQESYFRDAWSYEVEINI